MSQNAEKSPTPSRSDQGLLREQTDTLSRAISKKIRRVEGWSLGFRIGLVLIGGLLATIGGFLSEPSAGEVPWKTITGIGGALMALTGGVLLTIIERDQVNDLDKARRALDTAQTFLSNRDQLLRQFDDMRRLDSKRRNLIAALNAMREAAEQTAYSGTTDAKKAIEDLLDVSLTQLLAAMGYEAGELHAVSVYHRERREDGVERLVRLVDRRSNRSEEATHTREWEIGEGYTGAAWQREAEVVLDNTADPAVASAFHVPSAKLRDDDGERYRSVASFPIRVGPESEMWGVVTITSDRAKRFSSIPDAKAAQNVDAARTLGGMIALLAGFAYMNRKNGCKLENTGGEQDHAERQGNVEA